MNYLILALAVFRLSSLFAEEEGPFHLFDRIRHFIGVRYDVNGLPMGNNVIANGITCVWCNSVWFGTIITVAYYLMPDITILLCLPLSLSAAAVIVWRVANG